MAKIGYARVSTISQSLETQINLLKAEGCIKIFSEKVSGKKTNRSKLDECLKYLREDDVLVVTKIDRLGRTTKQLISLSISNTKVLICFTLSFVLFTIGYKLVTFLSSTSSFFFVL